MQVKHQGMDGSVQKYPYFPTHRSTWHLHLITRASQVPHCFKITASTSLSLSRETVSRQFGIARFLCFLAKQSTSTVHTISSPLPLLPETFSRENKESPGGSRWRERAWRRNAVVGWFRRTWREVGRRENPWEWSCEGEDGVDARLGSTEGEKKLPAKNINNAF